MTETPEATPTVAPVTSHKKPQKAPAKTCLLYTSGILQLMEKNGYIYRECAKQDARLKRILPTEKAESLRQPILHSIEEDEAAMIRGIPKEDVELCKQVLWQLSLIHILSGS